MNKTIFIVALEQEINYQSKILDLPVLFSGVGKVNATIAAMKSISLGFNNIINIGSSGSSVFPVNEVIKVGLFFQDIDCTPLCKYGETLFEKDNKFINFDNSNSFSCFTTDYFYDQHQISKYNYNYLEMIKNCSVYDMESYSIAKVCKLNEVNFTCFKWVSDNGESDSWERNCKIGFEKTKEIIQNEFKKERIQEL
jgi:adenosylhomocysteine nucleosidase